jgi:hypothetical protein
MSCHLVHVWTFMTRYEYSYQDPHPVSIFTPHPPHTIIAMIQYSEKTSFLAYNIIEIAGGNSCPAL